MAGICGYIHGKISKKKKDRCSQNNNRVLILVNHDVVIYNFRLELVQRLITEGYEVHISTPIGEHTGELRSLGAHIHEISFDRHGTNLLEELKLLKYYKKLIKAVKPVMVFTYTVKCNIYGGMASRQAQIPFCANITGLGTTINGGGVEERLVLILYKIGLRKAQRVFFQNEKNKDLMIGSNVVSSPYTVLPGSGVNLERHTYEPYPNEDNGIIISYIGRIMKDKGIDELLEAAKKLKKTHTNVQYRLIGFFDDDYEKTVRKAEWDGFITYISQQADIHPWMAESHAIIMPSYHEGMSNVILEAAATGRPVLCSDIPGCREGVDDGKSGLLFKVKSSQAVADAVERFLKMSHEERESMGKAGRAKMERCFNRDTVVDMYMKEIQEIGAP